MCDSQAFKYDKKLPNCVKISKWYGVCVRAHVHVCVTSPYRRHPRPAPRCWLSSTRWRSCTHCSRDACTCWPPPGWILGRRGPRRSRPSCQTDGQTMTNFVNKDFSMWLLGFFVYCPFCVEPQTYTASKISSVGPPTSLRSPPASPSVWRPGLVAWTRGRRTERSHDRATPHEPPIPLPFPWLQNQWKYIHIQMTRLLALYTVDFINVCTSI